MAFVCKIVQHVYAQGRFIIKIYEFELIFLTIKFHGVESSRKSYELVTPIMRRYLFIRRPLRAAVAGGPLNNEISVTPFCQVTRGVSSMARGIVMMMIFILYSDAP